MLVPEVRRGLTRGRGTPLRNVLSHPQSSWLRNLKSYSIKAGVEEGRSRVVATVSGVVKKTVIIPAVSEVAPTESSIPDDAFHPIKHRPSILGRIAAAVHGFPDAKTVERIQGASGVGKRVKRVRHRVYFTENNTGENPVHESVCALRNRGRPKPTGWYRPSTPRRRWFTYCRGSTNSNRSAEKKGVRYKREEPESDRTARRGLRGFSASRPQHAGTVQNEALPGRR